MLTPPNICTFARVALVPLFVLLWHTVHDYASIATASVFILASVTDWLDGYLARRMKITSAFGAFLDPVADKIMVSTALVLLATAPPVPISSFGMAVPVCLMIGREITMSALREWAAASGGGAHKAVKVNSLGKWKTALQMVAMSALLLLRNADHLLGDEPLLLEWLHYATWLAWLMLWVATVLALWSLANYMSGVWHFFRFPGVPKPPRPPRHRRGSQPLRPAGCHLQQLSSAPRLAQRAVWAAAETQQQGAAAAALASSDSEDRVPPGCSRYTVSLPKPLGLVLEEGKGGRGVYVAEIVAKGNAAEMAPEISVGDELIATNGLTFTTEQVYNDNIVRGGETYVRLNVRNNDFKTVMAAIGSIKPPMKVVLEFQRCE
ncbi:hypothetical protein COHA_005635 [Chlorella ohadii]|uniref:PDZ domain-containing protein n=1 Tax=Chlorella ohadii TaxID=2649997 RepID=A0AAD5DQD7_9CHLO|nr:hypothetical protein COHA_005635 [Chlorella ohadii]